MLRCGICGMTFRLEHGDWFVQHVSKPHVKGGK